MLIHNTRQPGTVKAVKLIFDLYTRVGLSRRQISARLNAEGLAFNGGPFTHPDVTNILRNPAYAGDTVFGKTQTGELQTFDAHGLVVEVKAKREGKHRDVSECLVRRGTHEPLVDRKTFELAQRKLEAERERISHSPRNPDYYLKQLFVCGHCGQGMRGRTEADPDTGERRVVYVCASYVTGRCNGHPSPCGYHRISHADAEALLLGKVRELNLPLDLAASDGVRSNLQARLERIGRDDEESNEQWHRWLTEGIDALADYLSETDPRLADYPAILKVRKVAFYWFLGDLEGEPDGHRPIAAIKLCVRQVREAVQEAERTAVDQAKARVAELRAEHATYTKNWAKATDEMQGVLKAEIDRLEASIREWEPRMVPLSERFNALYAAEAEREVERKKLLAEWPALEKRERGEAMRRLFKTVTLFWNKTFHPALAKPTRPRRTERPGRWSYSLKRDGVQWSFAASDLDSFR